jgi:hypothetical protein
MYIARTGGLIGAFISLAVVVFLFFVVRPAINDTTDRAFDTANRAIDEASRQADDIRTEADEATLGADGDYFSAASFGAVVAQVKDRVGSDGELLDLTVSKQGGGNVKYRTGNRAAGYQWGPGHSGLDPVKVTLIGNGKLSENVFPIAKLHADATTKLAAAVHRAAGDGIAIQAMSLGLDPVTGAVQWTVTGENHGRAVIYSAQPDASGLQRVS